MLFRLSTHPKYYLLARDNCLIMFKAMNEWPFMCWCAVKKLPVFTHSSESSSSPKNSFCAASRSVCDEIQQYNELTTGNAWQAGCCLNVSSWRRVMKCLDWRFTMGWLGWRFTTRRTTFVLLSFCTVLLWIPPVHVAIIWSIIVTNFIRDIDISVSTMHKLGC